VVRGSNFRLEAARAGRTSRTAKNHEIARNSFIEQDAL
jgi:hypothetical protein